MNRSNSENFITRMQKGKEDALEWAYDNYVGLVKSIIYQVVGKFNDSGVIEECINDVFISVWNNCNKFKGNKDNFRNWIGAIARFKAIDYYRDLSKSNTEQLNEELSISDNELESEVISQENKEEVIILLNQLEAIDKKIFIMKYFLGMKAEEIAKKLGISKNAVDGRVYRSKKKLRKNAEKINMEVI